MSSENKRIADMNEAEFEDFMNSQYDDYLEYDDSAATRVAEPTPDVDDDDEEKSTTYTFEVVIRGTMSTLDRSAGDLDDFLQMAKGEKHPDDRFIFENALDEGTLWVTEVVQVKVIDQETEEAGEWRSSRSSSSPTLHGTTHGGFMTSGYVEPPTIKGR